MKQLLLILSILCLSIAFAEENITDEKKLDAHGWNISNTAESIELKQANLSRKIKELYLRRND